MTTIFATKSHPEYLGLIPLVLVDGSNTPDELMAVDDLTQVKEVVFACYGADAKLVPMSKFIKEVEARSYHAQEMIDLLVECDYDGVDLPSYIVYGSPMRPMRASWARIDGAVFIDADKSTSGFHSYVAVPAELDKEMIDRYELAFVSRPSVK